MVYTRNQLEDIIIGTLLNDFGEDGFLEMNGSVLKKEMFSNRRNAFIFSVLEKMHADGIKVTTPLDVLVYTESHGIPYGDRTNFICYMESLATRYYVFSEFRKYLKQLMDFYLREKRYG